MLEKKGYKKDSAGAIAAHVGREKLGNKEFEHRAKIGREKAKYK